MTSLGKAGNPLESWSSLDRFQMQNKKSPENIEAIKKLSEEFEGIFMEIVLKSMRDSVSKSELIDGGNGEQIFQSMLDSEYAKNMAAQRSSGLADSIERHLLSMMEDAKAKPSIGKEQVIRAYTK